MNTYIAKTVYGLEQVLANELASQGASDINILTRAVSFSGDLSVLYRANLWCRTAIRIIKPIATFKAHNETVFYKRLRRILWTDMFTLDNTFAVHATVHSSIFKHSKYIALKTKDAIVDEFRRVHDNQRPNIDTANPDFLIDVRVNEKEVTVSLDSSGPLLNRRGYRAPKSKAPLNEVLAAGMLRLADWHGQCPLYDPMCGSGTILAEAILMATNTPPQWQRTFFGFQNWPDYDPALWQSIKSASNAAQKTLDVDIMGSDIEANQAQLAMHVLSTLPQGDQVKIKSANFLGSEKPFPTGMIITNPPYDQRITIAHEDLYKSIGDTLKSGYKDWQAWILSGYKEGLKKIGLRTSKRLTLYNGSIACKYHRYDMYAGSKKQKANST